MGLFLFQLDVPAARSGAGRRQLAADVVGAPAEHTAVPGKLAAAPTTRCILEARIGMRGLRSDPMPGLCRRWLDRWLQECNPASAYGTKGPSQRVSSGHG